MATDAVLTLAGLFIAALLAATLVPFQSEVTLVAALSAGTVSPAAAITASSLGNIIGSQINWALGLFIEHFKHRRWFPVSEAQLERAQRWYLRYGVWSLLLAWTPFIGDPLTVVAGVMRTPFWLFTAIVAISKIGRYLVVYAIYVAW